MQPPADGEDVLGSTRKTFEALTARIYDISNDSSTGERARRTCADVDGAAAAADRSASPARTDTAAIAAHKENM